MRRGDQIAYVPDHAKGITEVEFGFVYNISSLDSEIIFYRYWLKSKLGQLRTVANSEATHIHDLVLYNSVSPELVQETMEVIKNG